MHESQLYTGVHYMKLLLFEQYTLEINTCEMQLIEQIGIIWHFSLDDSMELLLSFLIKYPLILDSGGIHVIVAIELNRGFSERIALHFQRSTAACVNIVYYMYGLFGYKSWILIGCHKLNKTVYFWKMNKTVYLGFCQFISWSSNKTVYLGFCHNPTLHIINLLSWMFSGINSFMDFRGPRLVFFSVQNCLFLQKAMIMWVY